MYAKMYILNIHTKTFALWKSVVNRVFFFLWLLNEPELHKSIKDSSNELSQSETI